MNYTSEVKKRWRQLQVIWISSWGFGPAIKVLEIEPKSHAELVGLHKGDILPEEVCREND